MGYIHSIPGFCGWLVEIFLQVHCSSSHSLERMLREPRVLILLTPQM